MLPEGWVKSKLKNITIKIGSGVTPKGGSDSYETSGVPLIRSQNVLWGSLNFSEVAYIHSDQHAKMKGSKVIQGDVLLNITGASIGRSAFYNLPSEANVNQHVCIIRPNSKAIPEYLKDYLLSSYGQKQIDQFQAGGNRQGLNFEQIGSFVINLPPLPEQKKITQILSTWDNAISATERLLENSQQRKKALMQQLLTGKKRLLDKNGGRFSGEWKVSKLSKLFERVTTKNNGQSTNVVTISGQHGLIRQEDFFKKTVASETLDGYFLLKQGQFAYNKSYSNGYPMGAIKRLNRYPDGVVTTLYICFELSDSGRADSDFWEHYFESGLLNKGLSQIAHEGGRAHDLLNVKPSDFFSLKVPTPSFEEQQKIAAVLSTADQEISVLQQKLDALKQEKKALMQQLLTGKRRVTLN